MPPLHWRQRFEQLKTQIEIHYFSNPDEVEAWYKSSDQSKTTLFLLDFEIIGNKRTGLDLSELLGIGSKTILVSSRWEEKQVQERSAKIGMRLIPKGLAGFVPISIQKSLEKVDAVLLDDDSIIHSLWNQVAKQNQKSLRSFYDPQAFFAALEGIDRSSPVFIDSNLSNGVKGQDLVPRIRSLGFNLIHLATGYQATEFETIPGLTSVVGKDAPTEIGGVAEEWT